MNDGLIVFFRHTPEMEISRAVASLQLWVNAVLEGTYKLAIACESLHSKTA